MKLHQTDLSPFASPVRMQVYAKGFAASAIVVLPPPGGPGQPVAWRVLDEMRADLTETMSTRSA